MSWSCVVEVYQLIFERLADELSDLLSQLKIVLLGVTYHIVSIREYDLIIVHILCRLATIDQEEQSICMVASVEVEEIR